MHTFVTLMTPNDTLVPADKIRREDIELMIFSYCNARARVYFTCARAGRWI